MTDLSTYPLIDDFETTLAQARDGATGTVYLNDAVGVTIPASTTTYIVANPGKNIMQVAKINAVDNTAKTATVSSISVDKGAGVAYTQQTHPVGSIVRISTNYAFWKDIADAINSKLDTNANINFNYYATTTARDADLPSPTVGKDYAFCLDTGLLYYYGGSGRVALDTGTVTANASTTVAGKVEQATTAQNTAGTATGETGAPLFSTPAGLATQIQSGTWTYGADAGGDDTYVVALTPTLTAYTTGQRLYAKVTTANTGACSFDFGPGAKNVKTKDGNDPQSGVVRGIVELIYDGTNLVLQNEDFATTSNKGIVEMATDAEALAGTDETRYVNPKQLLASKTYNQTITKVNASINTGTANTTSINLSSKGGFITAYGFVTNTSGSSRNMYSRLQISDNGSSWSTLTDLLNVTVSGTSAQPDYIRSFSFIVSKGKYIRGEVYGSGTNSGAYIEIAYQELT